MKLLKEIRLAHDTIDKTELLSLSEWLTYEEKLTKGQLTVQFENNFAAKLNSRYSIYVNSGSSANLLMIYALLESGRLKNKNVIAPTVSWVTTVSPLIQLGFNIKLCECDKNNLGININQFEKLCREHQPSLAIIVHVLGHSNHMKELIDICNRYNIILLEDTCEALGSEYEHKKLGTFGLAGSYSFYYGHHISTIEGGAVTTDDYDLYNIMLSIRSHGWGRDIDEILHEKWKEDYDIDEFRALYTFYYPGFNLRSTDLNAYIGIKQLNKLADIITKRKLNYFLYKEFLSDYWCQTSNSNVISSFAYGVLVENRMEVYKHLKKKNIETRPLVCGNIGRHPFWIKRYGRQNFHNADIIHDHGLYLPNNYNILPSEIKFVCDTFREVAIPKHL